MFQRGPRHLVLITGLVFLVAMGCTAFHPPARTRAVSSASVSARGFQTSPAEGSRNDGEAPEFSALARQVLEAHNREREQEGLKPLELQPQLCDASAVHAQAMAAAKELSHDGPADQSTPADRVKKAGYRYRETGENIALGQGSVKEVMEDWMGSPGHRKNILTPTFTQMGFGKAKDDEDQPYWCVEFGRPWEEIPTAGSSSSVLEEVNRRREEQKLPPLESQSVLDEIAGQQAELIAKAEDPGSVKMDDIFGKVKARGLSYRRASLSLGLGLGTAAELVDHLMEQKGQREAVLGEFDRLGVGVAKREDGSPVWLLLFTGNDGR